MSTIIDIKAILIYTLRFGILYNFSIDGDKKKHNKQIMRLMDKLNINIVENSASDGFCFFTKYPAIPESIIELEILIKKIIIPIMAKSDGSSILANTMVDIS